MRTSELKANLSTPLSTATETNAGIARFATRDEILESSELPLIVTPQEELLLSGYRNAIINGDFSIAQRGTSFLSYNGYVMDRWAVSENATGIWDISRIDGPFEGTYALRMTCSTADPSIGDNDYYHIFQKIEGYNVRSFRNNPITLSFYVRSSIVGIFCISFRTSQFNRSYVQSFTINQPNTWEKKTIIAIPSLSEGSPGTVDYSTGIGMMLAFSLINGNNFNTSNLGVWHDGNFIGTPGQTNFMATIGTTFDIAQVQVEPGNTVTPFEYLPISVQVDLCQRYFEKSYDLEIMPGTTTETGVFCAIRPDGDSGVTVLFKTKKRVSPVVSIYSPVTGSLGYVRNSTHGIDQGGSYGVAGMSGFRIECVSASVSSGFRGHWTADSEL
jgi:hypothetical protein